MEYSIFSNATFGDKFVTERGETVIYCYCNAETHEVTMLRHNGYYLDKWNWEGQYVGKFAGKSSVNDKRLTYLDIVE